MVRSLTPELVIVSAHFGRPGDPSAVVTVVRQVEGSRPEGVDRSYPVKWSVRYYLAGAERFDATAAYGDVVEAIGTTYADERTELAHRKVAVVNLSGQTFLTPALRKHRIGRLVSVAVSDGKHVTEAPGLVTVGKPDLVGILVAMAQTDRLRVLDVVNNRAGIVAALDTVSSRAPRPPRDLPPGELPPPSEDPAILALQYALWMGETRMPWRDVGRGVEVAEEYNPMARGN